MHAHNLHTHMHGAHAHTHIQRETHKSLLVGWGSRGPCAVGHTTQAWRGYLRGHWGCWGPVVWMKFDQTPLEEDPTWEASHHLHTKKTLQHKHTWKCLTQSRSQTYKAIFNTTKLLLNFWVRITVTDIFFNRRFKIEYDCIVLMYDTLKFLFHCHVNNKSGFMYCIRPCLVLLSVFSPAWVVIGWFFSGSAGVASCATGAGCGCCCFRLATNSSCWVFRTWICCWKASWIGCTTAAYSVIKDAYERRRGCKMWGCHSVISKW